MSYGIVFVPWYPMGYIPWEPMGFPVRSEFRGTSRGIPQDLMRPQMLDGIPMEPRQLPTEFPLLFVGTRGASESFGGSMIPLIRLVVVYSRSYFEVSTL